MIPDRFASPYSNFIIELLRKVNYYVFRSCSKSVTVALVDNFVYFPRRLDSRILTIYKHFARVVCF